MIDDLFTSLVHECLSFTEQFLTRPQDLQIGIADYSSGKFVHKNVPAVTSADGGFVLFNRDWLIRSLPDHADDVRFFIYHELRHVHQKYQIAKKNSNENISENESTLILWNDEFKNYQTNYGDAESQKHNLMQEIELDANSYAIAMLNMRYLGNQEWSFEYSLPQDAYEAADKRCREYYKTRPELKRYYDRRYRDITGKMSCERTPGRNEPCPCGSGKKYKQCCLGTGIYD